MMKRKTKKSETLQVRLPFGMKRDFMQRCEAEGRPASDVLRAFIDSYLADPVQFLTSEKAVMIRRTFIYPSLAAATLLGLVVVVLPATSQADSLREDFAGLDADRDGFIAPGEFKRPDDGVMYSMVPTSPAPKSVAPSRPAGGSTTRITDGRRSLATAFERLDADGDGRLAFEEYRVMRVGAAHAIFRLGDANADRRLTQDEYVAGVSLPAPVLAKIRAKGAPAGFDAMIAQARSKAVTRFKRLDADRDGTLTLEEITPS